MRTEEDREGSVPPAGSQGIGERERAAGLAKRQAGATAQARRPQRRGPDAKVQPALADHPTPELAVAARPHGWRMVQLGQPAVLHKGTAAVRGNSARLRGNRATLGAKPVNLRSERARLPDGRSWPREYEEALLRWRVASRGDGAMRR